MKADREIVAFESEIVKGSRRTTVTLIQKKSWAKIYAHLTPSMQDAAKEIEMVFIYITGGMGYGITDLNHVKGYGQLDPSEYMKTMTDRYIQWKSFPPSITNKVINMFVGGNTLTELSEKYKLSKKTCMKHIRDGLNEYCKIAGWGEQLKPE